MIKKYSLLAIMLLAVPMGVSASDSDGELTDEEAGKRSPTAHKLTGSAAKSQKGAKVPEEDDDVVELPRVTHPQQPGVSSAINPTREDILRAFQQQMAGGKMTVRLVGAMPPPAHFTVQPESRACEQSKVWSFCI